MALSCSASIIRSVKQKSALYLSLRGLPAQVHRSALNPIQFKFNAILQNLRCAMAQLS